MTTSHTAAEKLERIRHFLATFDDDTDHYVGRHRIAFAEDLIRMIDDPQTRFVDSQCTRLDGHRS